MPLHRFSVATLCAAMLLSGCGTISSDGGGKHNSSLSVSGRVHGGQQPVAGSTIQLYSIGGSGDGAAANARLQSTVTTDANGNFTITGLYNCNSAGLMYILSTGGMPLTGITNPNLVLMTTLGQCSSLGPGTFISINELTSVAAVSAITPYMSSPTAVSNRYMVDDAAAQTAFNLSAEYVDPSLGTTPGTGAPTGTVVPSAMLNTLADIMASCVNSSGGSAGDGSPCGTLFSLATPVNGTAPTDTVTAMLNIANNPELNVTALYNMASPSAPFQPTLASAPSNLQARLTPSSGSAAGRLLPTPLSLQLPPSPVSDITANRTVTLNNTGMSTVNIFSISLVGVNASEFTMTSACGSSITAGSSCYVDVGSTPANPGGLRRTGLLVVSDAPDSPQYVPLSSEGVVFGTGTNLWPYGYNAFGDSNTAGAGYAPAYPSMLYGQFGATSTMFNNYGHSGDDCALESNVVFTHMNPQDTGNPVVTNMIGTNGAQNTTTTVKENFLIGCQMAINARSALSASSTVLAGSANVTQTGSWTADTTFSFMNGLYSTTNGSCLTSHVTVPNGVFYVFYRYESGSSNVASFQVSVDGGVATDTVSGSQTLVAQSPDFVSDGSGLTSWVVLARYPVSTGAHDISACVTSATATANEMHIYGFAYPPATPVGGVSGPRVYMGGVMHVQDDPNDATYPGFGISNGINKSVAMALAADGLRVKFVDVQAYVDAHYGMLSSPARNCNASGNPGLHVNDCGTVSLKQAFADAINSN